MTTPRALAGKVARRFGASEEQLVGTLKVAQRLSNSLRSAPAGDLHRTLVELSGEYPGSRALRAASRIGRPQPSIATIAHRLDRGHAQRLAAIRTRMVTLLRTLGNADEHLDALSTAELLELFEAALQTPDAETVWLALAVLDAELPDVPTVLHTARIARLDGPISAFVDVLWSPRIGPSVRVISGAVLVDVHHTARTNLATGIQRVARQSAYRWHRDHAVTLVGWSADYTMLRELDTVEQRRALTGEGPAVDRADLGPQNPAEVLVPWRNTFLLPELVTEQNRIDRIHAILRFSGSASGAIGFDCVPITTAETVGAGMGGAFSNIMGALAHTGRIVAISEGAAGEYRGWRTMLGGAGLSGPEIKAVSLPTEASVASPEALDRARGQLLTAGLPLVLCVGSHEPRKNHGAVLHAANLLWRGGHEFSLLFIGGNAWNSEGFLTRMAELQGEGRPVESLTALDDDLLWAAYELAHCVIFPSLNEGFGLPVAESLATGTPVITSNFGSMREIAAGGGALLVNPRDDHEIRDALGTLLTDKALYARLQEEARARSPRTWEQYAAETWAYLVDGSAGQGIEGSRA